VPEVPPKVSQKCTEISRNQLNSNYCIIDVTICIIYINRNNVRLVVITGLLSSPSGPISSTPSGVLFLFEGDRSACTLSIFRL